MMIPKIEFRYSKVYDRNYRGSSSIQKILKKKGIAYPSARKILNYIKKSEKVWKRVDRKVFNEISKVTGLKWKEKEIRCYVIGFGRPFSDPLTVKLYNNINDFIDVLTHELIHQIQTQNAKRVRKWVDYINKKYKNESRLTRNHILIHSVHQHIYYELFDKKRLNRNLKRSEHRYDYKRAWEIVQEEGVNKIIKRFGEVTK